MEHFNEWIDLVHDDDYEINIEEPYFIRKKSTKRILKESKKDGYFVITLNGRQYYKHRIIGEMFLDNPDNLPCIDHINHDRGDNRTQNLRWVSYSENNKNKTCNKYATYNYVDEINEDSIEVRHYGNHEFEDLYFDVESDTFYYFNGIRFRELYVGEEKRNGALYVYAYDNNNKLRKLFYSKFKREYELI